MISLSIHLDIPIALNLSSIGSAATTPRQLAAWGGVDGQREEVLRFHKVRDHAAADEEVNPAEAVGEEDGDEDDVEDSLPAGSAAGGVA